MSRSSDWTGKGRRKTMPENDCEHIVGFVYNSEGILPIYESERGTIQWLDPDVPFRFCPLCGSPLPEGGAER